MFFIYKVWYEYDNGATYDHYNDIVASPEPLNTEEIKSVLYQKYNDYEGVITKLRALNKWDSTSEFEKPTIL